MIYVLILSDKTKEITEFISMNKDMDKAINYAINHISNTNSEVNIRGYLSYCGSYMSGKNDDMESIKQGLDDIRLCIIDTSFDISTISELDSPSLRNFYKNRFNEMISKARFFIRELKINELGI